MARERERSHLKFFRKKYNENKFPEWMKWKRAMEAIEASKNESKKEAAGKP